MRKLFVLAEHVNPFENSTGYYWFSIINELSKRFGVVRLVCPRNNRYRILPDVADGFEKTRSIDNVDIFKNSSNVHVCPVANGSPPGVNSFAKLCGQIALTIRFVFAFLKSAKDGDVLICGTNPAVLIVILPLIKKFKKFKWILLIHDVFPENLVPAKILSKRNVLYMLAKRYFDFVYATADKTIVIGRDMRDLIEKKTGRIDRTVFIPNWVDPEDVFPISKNETFLVKKLQWEEKTVFQFFGNMGRLQGINNILAAIQKVSNKNAAFLFIGDGVMGSVVKKFITEHPDLSVSHHGAVSLEVKNDVLSACDVAFVTLEAGMLGLGVPSKSYFSLAADKPLLLVAESESEVARMISENSVGWQCQPDDPDTLAALIDKICELDLNEFRGRQRALILSKYTKELALNDFSTCVLNELVD